MRIETLRPELDSTYEEYLLGHNSSLIYYSTKYKDFLKELLGCEEQYLLAVGKTGICGVLPLMYLEGDEGRVYNSLPYYGSNGGILTEDVEASRELAKAYSHIARSKITISSTVVGNPFAQQNTTDILHNYTEFRVGQFTRISCQQEPWDEIMGRVDSTARRNVNKAIREGITVEVDHTQIERLKDMHQTNIRAIGGIPKTDEFFSLVPQHFSPGQDFDVYVARQDGIVIAGLLVFYFHQTVEYFTPATDVHYRAFQPSALILATAMVDASRRGFMWWNWGGTWASQVGVYRFKRKWGAMERRYWYHTRLNDQSVLSWSREKILTTFPGFFVVPFSELQGEEQDG